jgi:hypothetical protein
MDSGATTGVIDRRTAHKLGLHIEPTESHNVRFRQGTPVPATECARGAGFVENLAVIDGVAATLSPSASGCSDSGR